MVRLSDLDPTDRPRESEVEGAVGSLARCHYSPVGAG